MRRPFVAVCASALLTLAGCSTNTTAPAFQLRCSEVPFRGITETDVDGQPIGSADDDDWGCVEDSSGALALCFEPAHPNPAGPLGLVQLELAVPTARRLRIEVFSQGGRPLRRMQVRTLADREFVAGWHQLAWDFTDDSGHRLPPGIYRVTLESDGRTICGDVAVR